MGDLPPDLLVRFCSRHSGRLDPGAAPTRYWGERSLVDEPPGGIRLPSLTAPGDYDRSAVSKTNFKIELIVESDLI